MFLEEFFNTICNKSVVKSTLITEAKNPSLHRINEILAIVLANGLQSGVIISTGVKR